MNYFVPEPSLDPPEPKIFCACPYCQGEIYEGEEYILFDGEAYHTDCFSDYAAQILLDNYGAIRCVADRGDADE